VFTLNLRREALVLRWAHGKRVPPRPAFWNIGLLLCEQRFAQTVKLHGELPKKQIAFTRAYCFAAHFTANEYRADEALVTSQSTTKHFEL
jgi:hypothetical protein